MWVQSTIATRHGCVDMDNMVYMDTVTIATRHGCVDMDNMVYMGTVNNSNNTWMC